MRILGRRRMALMLSVAAVAAVGFTGTGEAQAAEHHSPCHRVSKKMWPVKDGGRVVIIKIICKGQRGPRGPRGPRGKQGPPGRVHRPLYIPGRPAVINGLHVQNVDGGRCPRGTHPIGGAFTTDQDRSIVVTASGPRHDRWRMRLRNQGLIRGSGRVWTICQG